MSDIRCVTCPLMNMLRCAKYIGNNSHIDKPRNVCFCKHPDAKAAFDLLHPNSDRLPGVIALTKGSDDKPAIKTSPRWCPRNLMERPKGIDRKGACKVIETRKPRGLFFVVADVVTGIDNRTGDVWTEDFATKRECLKWLSDKRTEE